MKISLLRIAFVLLLAAVYSSCTPEAHKELGAPTVILPALAGTWKLTKAVQVDEDAKRKGFPYKELDLTQSFAYSDFVLKLDLNNGAPSTFTTVPGNSPKIIKLTSGTWTVDNIEAPQQLTLTNGSTSEIVTLGGYPVVTSSILKITVVRKDETGKVVISYSYEFAKQ